MTCEIWYHVSCDPLISDAQYDSFVDSPTDDPWFCSRCTQFGDAPALPKHIPADKALNCLYLNARSIFSKRLDLAVCLTILQYDIVAITESLDDSITDSLIVPPSYVGLFFKLFIAFYSIKVPIGNCIMWRFSSTSYQLVNDLSISSIS